MVAFTVGALLTAAACPFLELHLVCPISSHRLPLVKADLDPAADCDSLQQWASNFEPESAMEHVIPGMLAEVATRECLRNQDLEASRVVVINASMARKCCRLLPSDDAHVS
ncbi:unnamed protein product [Polarella glacialis]|uniref:Uncharacterized protein n=1 Tax=Polarella glacialis TaxID=89957 RepID=A0A813H4Q8_POLGL|nr:unnamed protein product [Polarella glacialis]